MMGLRFGAEGMAMAASKMCFDAGLFAVYANNDTSVLQLLPPLVTSDDEAEEVCSRLSRIFP
jgi:acetylornithine/succinyldiaminopimelate/putrescine aminotransferase